MTELLSDPQAWMALATLTLLELVLGIDNVVFISILTGKLPEAQRPQARTLGLGLAMLMRIALLFAISWLVGLTEPLFSVLEHAVSGRDLILIVGGLFLLGKSVHEIHDKLEGEEHGGQAAARSSFLSVLLQIIALDAVFSLDSVLTAVGMTEHLPIMVTAVVISIVLMMVFAGPVSDFVERRPTVKMLALSFLLLIGMMLVAEGMGHHIPKGYIYFSIAFAMFVEALNLQVRKPKADPVQLRRTLWG